MTEYKLIERIKSGTMGEVFRAVDQNGRVIAIKFLGEAYLQKPSARRRFIQEARIASELHHPNIVEVLQVGEGQQPFIAMEFVEGQNLFRLLRSLTADHRHLPVVQILHLSLGITAALAAAHEAAIVHRDLKPANVMVDQNGNAKLIDFGLSKTLESSDASDWAGINSPLMDGASIPGQVCYFSPEQAREGLIGIRSDIFSFGVLLYEMLTGTNPFARESNLDTLYAIIGHEPAPPSSLRPELHPEWDRIVGKLLAKEIADRYASIEDARRDLQAMKTLDRSGFRLALARRQSQAVQSFKSKSRRWKIGAAAAILIPFIATGSFIGNKLWHQSPKPHTVTQQENATVLVIDQSTVRRLDIESKRTHTFERSTALEFWPAPSPDGDRLIVQAANARQSMPFSILLMKRDEGSSSPIGEGIEPSWSPDGRRIAFLRFDKQALDLWVYDIENRSSTKIAESVATLGYNVFPAGPLSSPNYSWSGNHSIVFVKKLGGTSNVYEYSIASASTRTVTENKDANLRIAAPIRVSSNSVCYVSFRNRRWTAHCSGMFDTEEVANPLEIIGWNGELVVAYWQSGSLDKSASAEVYAFAINGARRHIASLPAAQPGSIKLNPAGNRLAFAGDNQISILSFADNVVRSLYTAESGRYLGGLKWSHDGQSVYFSEHLAQAQ